MLIDDIKKANIEAMKNHDSNLRSIYSVLINKYMQASINARTTGANVDDVEVVKIIQKTIKELDEECENYDKVGNVVSALAIKQQKEALSVYLPQMLTVAEIKEIVLKLEDKTLPSVMRHFKTNYNGKCDMKLVADVLKSL